METWDAIRSRRNVRLYEDRPLSAEELDRIVEAGWRSPSAQNLQRWDFVVCTDRAQLQALSGVWRGAGHLAGAAAAVVMVAPVTEETRIRQLIEYDLGQATMSMMLAAADLGIGSGHSSVGDQAEARRILGVPEDRFCAYMLALGRPADRPLKPIRSPDRRPFDDVVHRGGW
jgi:nitroreductase